MEAMASEGIRPTEYELFVAWFVSVLDLFASCLASAARDC